MGTPLIPTALGQGMAARHFDTPYFFAGGLRSCVPTVGRPCCAHRQSRAVRCVQAHLTRGRVRSRLVRHT